MSREFNNNKQHDAAEFLQSLLEHLWNDPSLPPDYCEQVFGGISQEAWHCKCGFSEELPMQPMADIIPIQLRGVTVQSCLSD